MFLQLNIWAVNLLSLELEELEDQRQKQYFGFQKQRGLMRQVKIICRSWSYFKYAIRRYKEKKLLFKWPIHSAITAYTIQ